MTWVRIDDHFPDHPKVTRVGPMGGWLYLCGLAYASRYLTDGFIPHGQVRRLAALRGVEQLAEGLVDAGLWERAEGGYRINDYLEYQPSAQRVRAEREKTARRQAEWLGRHKATPNSVSNAVTNGPLTPAPYPAAAGTPVPAGVNGLPPEVTAAAGGGSGGTPTAAAAVEPFREILSGLPGYDLSAGTLQDIHDIYGHLNLKLEARKLASWMKTRPKQRCNEKLVLSWLEGAERRRLESGHAATRNGTNDEGGLTEDQKRAKGIIHG